MKTRILEKTRAKKSAPCTQVLGKRAPFPMWSLSHGFVLATQIVMGFPGRPLFNFFRFPESMQNRGFWTCSISYYFPHEMLPRKTGFANLFHSTTLDNHVYTCKIHFVGVRVKSANCSVATSFAKPVDFPALRTHKAHGAMPCWKCPLHPKRQSVLPRLISTTQKGKTWT